MPGDGCEEKSSNESSANVFMNVGRGVPICLVRILKENAMTGVKVECPRCRCVLSLSAAEMGRNLKCPRCAALFRWSAPRSMSADAERSRWSMYLAVAVIAAAGLVLIGAVVGY